MPSASRRRAAVAALLASLAQRVHAQVSVQTSLASQVPQLAQAGERYAWTISSSTFADASSAAQPPSFQYSVDNLPSWCTFDAPSRTFSGTPSTGDLGRRWITVTASDSSGSDSDGFMLNVVNTPDVKVNKPLTQQLPIASSLSPGNILPDGSQHIPLGWSFSIGFAADSFTTSDGANLYYAARMADGGPLPSWLEYDPTTNTFWGVAPTQPGPDGATFNVTVSAARIAGYSDVRSSFALVVSQHALTLTGPLASPNITAGVPFVYAIPVSGIQLDGFPSPASNPVEVSVDVSQFSWLSFNAANDSLSGTPPNDLVAANANSTVVPVPVTFTDSYNSKLPTTLNLTVYPSLFTASQLPTLFVRPGVAFEQSIASSVRAPAGGNAPKVTASFSPISASQWLSFNSATLQLSGTPPADVSSDRVNVTFQADATSSNGVAQRATAYLGIAVQGDVVSSTAAQPSESAQGAAPSTTIMQSGGGGHGGLSAHGKIVLGVVLGVIGGLILLILLIFCCRRCVAVEDHDAYGRKKYYDDDATLASQEKSPKFGKGFLHPEKPFTSPHPGTPSTLVASPLPGHTAIKFADGETDPAAELASDNVKRSISGEDAPAKHMFFKSILKKSRSKPQLPISRPVLVEQSTLASSGLGLALHGEENPATSTDEPYGGVVSKSIRTIGSRKASWETDIFHETPVDVTQTANSTPKSIASKDETPVRRGAPVRQYLDSGTVRQRGAHSGASPAFTTTERFEATTSSEEELEATDLAEAQVKQVSHVQLRNVPARQPSVTDPSREPRHVDHEEGAFDDAEDETRSEEAKRASTMSYTMNRRGLEGIDHAIVYDDQLKSPAAGSTFGAASFIAGQMAPEQTMRAVDPARSEEAHMPMRQTGPEEPIQYGLGHPGEPLRVKLKLRTPPPLQGGHGSPGKRSGRKTVHLPLLDDPSSTEHLTLPDWLCWLTWDARLCELSGMVPSDLTTACKIPIVVIARSHDGSSLGHNSSIGHTRHSSTDSSGVFDEVAARCELELRPKDWVMPIDY